MLSAKWKVTGSIPSQGTYKKQPIDVSLSHQYFSPSLSPSLPFSLKNKLINKIIKIKPFNYQYTPIRVAKIFKDWVNQVLAYTTGGNAICYNHFRKRSVGFFKNSTNTYHMICYSALRFLPKQNETVCLNKDLYTNVHKNFILTAHNWK